jgi:hypothetical protein
LVASRSIARGGIVWSRCGRATSGSAGVPHVGGLRAGRPRSGAGLPLLICGGGSWRACGVSSGPLCAVRSRDVDYPLVQSPDSGHPHTADRLQKMHYRNRRDLNKRGTQGEAGLLSNDAPRGGSQEPQIQSGPLVLSNLHCSLILTNSIIFPHFPTRTGLQIIPVWQMIDEVKASSAWWPALSRRTKSILPPRGQAGEFGLPGGNGRSILPLFSDPVH